jgi:hypothetical protein
MFDISAGATTALEKHRRAMTSLVDVRGGIHNLESALPYALTLDRTVAIVTNTKPALSQVPYLLDNIARTPRHAQKYGSRFEGEASLEAVDRTILRYCSETCRAIEILEGEGFTFDPDEVLVSSEIHYLYFLRERLETWFAHLNAEHLNSHALDRSSLLATKIVTYIALMDNYIVEVPAIMANRLQSLVTSQLDSYEWTSHCEFFRWALFVLASMPNNAWKGRAWTLDVLKDMLRVEYGTEEWPSNWMERERNNVWQFAWAESRLGHSFNQACKDVTQSLSCLDNPIGK